MKKLGFIKEGFFHPLVVIKSADVNFNGSSLKNAAVGSDVGVFIPIPEFTPVNDEVHDRGDRLLSACDIMSCHLGVDRIGDEVGSFL